MIFLKTHWLLLNWEMTISGNSSRVKNYKTPQKSFGWVAYHLEKAIEPAAAKSLKWVRRMLKK